MDTTKLPDGDHLRVDDVAAYLQIHPATVRDWMRSEKLQGKKVGKRWYIVRASLVELLGWTPDA